MVKKLKLATFLMTLGISSILFSSLVMSQNMNIPAIIADNTNIIAYLSIGIVGFLWGVVSKYVYSN